MIKITNTDIIICVRGCGYFFEKRDLQNEESVLIVESVVNSNIVDELMARMKEHRTHIIAFASSRQRAERKHTSLANLPLKTTVECGKHGLAT